jgi:hypothetical protein
VAVDLNAKYPEKLHIRTLDNLDNNKEDYLETLFSTVKSLINREFELETVPPSPTQIDDDGIKMFQQSIPPLLVFLRTEYFPKIAHFKQEASTYKFESPLNFLMMRSDLKAFLESFF